MSISKRSDLSNRLWLILETIKYICKPRVILYTFYVMETSTDKSSNCYQWVSDLYTLFIEHEDEQRALTLKDGRSIVLHMDNNEANTLRAFIKQFGFKCHGLDYQHVADVCEGRKSTLHFVLSCDAKKANDYLDDKPLTLNQERLTRHMNKLSMGFMKALFPALNIITAATLDISSGGVAPFLFGMVAYSTYLWSKQQDVYMLKQLNDQIKIVEDDFSETLGLADNILEMEVIPSKKDGQLEIHVKVKGKELMKDAAEGKRVGSLFPPTERGIFSQPPPLLL